MGSRDPQKMASDKPSIALLLNPFAWLLWILDFLVWLVYFVLIGWVLYLIRLATDQGNRGVQVKGGLWRLNQPEANPDLIAVPQEGITTAWRCFSRAAGKFATSRCMGTRQYVGTWRQEPDHKIVKKVFADTHWSTYNQFHGEALAFGRGLLALGMVPSVALNKEDFEADDRPDTMLLWENTCAEWMTALAGAFSQSMVVATSYATLGMDGVEEAVQQCECRVVMCNRAEVAKLAAEKDKVPSLTTIIYTNMHVGGHEFFGNQPLPKGHNIGFHVDDLPELINGIKVISYEQVLASGECSSEQVHEPKPDNIAVVMYTSGSTGSPKGVVITHKNITASVAALSTNFRGWGVEGGETYLAYLPAAHILELCCEISMISFGAEIGYADPRTLSSTGAGRLMPDNSVSFAPDLNYAPGAIQAFAPTCMAAVPKIWDILKKGIEQKVDSGSPIVKFLFETAFVAVSNNTWRSCPLLSLVFRKVQAMTGNRMKIGISGGGPISGDVQTFTRTVFGMPVIQGYALTETCCAGTVQSHTDGRNGVVGAPVASVEIRLVSCPECNDRNGKPYMDTDTTHFDGSACKGRGEIHIRGNSVSLGYYAKGAQREALLKKTADEFDKDGWFHTGDIGFFTPDGCIKIVDRLKNLVKLKGGEYVALEQMEAVFGTSTYANGINGGVMVYADGDMDRAVALVQANMHALKQYATANSISFTNDEDLCANASVATAITADLNKLGKGKLSPIEVLSTVHLVSGSGPMSFPGSTLSPWTPDNGFLTASNKTDRTSILHGKRMPVDGVEVCSESFEVIIAALKKSPPRR